MPMSFDHAPASPVAPSSGAAREHDRLGLAHRWSVWAIFAVAACSARPATAPTLTPTPARSPAPLVLECTTPNEALRLYSDSPRTATPYETISGTYTLDRNQQHHEGSFSGRHNNAYGAILRVALQPDSISLVVQELPGSASATLYDTPSGEVVGGFLSCSGAVTAH